MLVQLGRFQPFHIGHLAIAKKAMEQFPDEPLLIGVILSNPPVGEHFIPEAEKLDKLAAGRINTRDNPWSALARVRAIRKAIAHEMPDRAIEVIPVPRPETCWGFFTTLIPEKRIWVLPKERDSFEQAKYDMYRAAGDEICEVVVDRAMVSGTEIRALIRESKNDKVIEKLPKGVLEELDTNI